MYVFLDCVDYDLTIRENAWLAQSFGSSHLLLLEYVIACSASYRKGGREWTPGLAKSPFLPLPTPGKKGFCGGTPHPVKGRPPLETSLSLLK
jgi:hypothetical protein